MHVIVLGAGIVGTTSAWYLAQSGHRVTVVDRQPGAGLETSFANGGQISVSHAEPWANPGAPKKILEWLGREDAPLLFRLRPDIHQWLWGLAFLRECTPARTRANIRAIVNLGLYSRASLQALRAQTGLQYDALQRGILHFYTDAKEFDAALAPAEQMRALGCDRRLKTAAECVAIEPALAAVEGRLAGGTYTPADESGDAHLFTQRLAALAAERGVRFRYGTRVLGLDASDARIADVRVADADGRFATLTADAYVVAMGSFSPPLLAPLGVRLPVYPAKGYSATLPIADASCAPSVSLTDDQYKLVFSRLGDRLRVAGTAELNGYSTDLNEVRCHALVRRALELFPGVADPQSARFWTGLRPATPSNVPLIGRARYANLFLNTGHGTLGWTEGCGSARALAELVAGRVPEVDFPFLGVDRTAAARRSPRPAVA